MNAFSALSTNARRGPRSSGADFRLARAFEIVDQIKDEDRSWRDEAGRIQPAPRQIAASSNCAA